MWRAKLSTSATLTCAELRPAPALTVLAGVAFKAKGGLQRLQPDATSSAFFEVALCTLRLSVIGGFVGVGKAGALASGGKDKS